MSIILIEYTLRCNRFFFGQQLRHFGQILASNEPVFAEVIKRAGTRLGTLLAEAVAILDPELVLLGGETLQLLGDSFVKTMILEIGKSAVERQVDQTMLADIAAAHRNGRRLFVTTNLDAQRPVLWNMGAIAISGQPNALELFRKVLVASASIPGLFDPVFIDSEAQGHHFNEMHVDGGTTLDVLPMPLKLAAAGRLDARRTPGQLYIIINNNLDPAFAMTKPKPCLLPLARSIRSRKATSIRRSWTLTCLRESKVFSSISPTFQIALR